MRKTIAAALCATALSACQSYTYEPIVPNPPNMEMTQARCQMLAGSADQGYFAYGSQSYVAGAAIGNALGNAIREDQFMQQCMTMSGWRRVALPPQHTSKPPQKNWTTRPAKLGGAFPPKPTP